MGRKLVEYKIISGNVVEIRRSFLTVRESSLRTRGNRIAGNSSARKIRANEQEQIKRLARLLNCNLTPEWLFVSLKFDDEHLPKDYAELEQVSARFMRKLRTEYTREYGHKPASIFVNSNWSPTNNRPARLHIHLLIEACSLDLLKKLWTGGGIATEDIDHRKDHTALAVYLIHNVQLGKAEAGKQCWHPSRGNLEKPIYTEPVEVSDCDDIRLPELSRQTAFERIDDEAGRTVSSYVRCILSERPKIRGRHVIMPRAKKRGGKKGGTDNVENPGDILRGVR